MTYTLHLGDCLPFMRDMAAGSVDAVIDYDNNNTTACDIMGGEKEYRQ